MNKQPFLHFLLTLFSLLLLHSSLCFAQTTAATDYMEFDKNGYLYTFKKTAPDGSFIEVSPTLVRGSETARIKIVCSNGEIFEGHINLAYWPDDKDGAYQDNGKEIERVYKEYVNGAESYDTAINKITSLVGRYSSFESMAMCLEADGMILMYSDEEDLRVSSFLVPLNKDDYMICKVKDGVWARYLNKSNMNDKYVGDLVIVRKKYAGVDAVLGFADLQMKTYQQQMLGELKYSDGSSYSGSLTIDDVDYYDWKYWMNAAEMPNFKYVNGTLTDKNGSIKAYVNGQYDEFETNRIKQMRAQKGGTARPLFNNPKDEMRTLDASSRAPGKFNGDWKATYRPEWSKTDIPLIMHIKGFTGSFEKSRRSPSEPKEEEMTWDYTGNRIEAVIEGDTFRGTLQNGKITGEYYVNGKAYHVTFVKMGDGSVNLNENYKIDRKRGIVIY